jgi:hypothetical protein
MLHLFHAAKYVFVICNAFCGLDTQSDRIMAKLNLSIAHELHEPDQFRKHFHPFVWYKGYIMRNLNLFTLKSTSHLRDTPDFTNEALTD